MFKVGETVRYGRTGTVGKIVAFMEERGDTFAELDITGMYYRIDQLTVIKEEKRREGKTRDSARDFKEEQEKIRDEKRRGVVEQNQYLVSGCVEIFP